MRLAARVDEARVRRGVGLDTLAPHAVEHEEGALELLRAAARVDQAAEVVRGRLDASALHALDQALRRAPHPLGASTLQNSLVQHRRRGHYRIPIFMNIDNFAQ